MKIRTKLAAFAIALTTGFAALGGLLYTTFQTVRVGGPLHAQGNLSKDLIADILPPPMYVLEAYMEVNKAVVVRSAAQTKAAAEALTRLRKDLCDREEFWSKNMTDAGVREALLNQATPPAKEFFAVASSDFFPALQAEDYSKATKVLTERLSPLYATHRQAIDRAVVLSTALAMRLDSESQATTAIRGSIALGLGCFALVSTAIGFMFFGRSITRPLNILNARMKELSSGEGDLTQRTGLSTDDELGDLSKSTDKFLNTLQDMVRQINDAAQQVAAASTEIAASSEEMSASACEVARQASNANQAAEESRELARTGGEIVAQTVTGIRSVERSVSESADGVKRLGARSEQIGEIIKVINDIADQTNLLALNAAIEAARAGEHGRGFAVVADAVRKLAERTTRSTEQVGDSIRSIQEETSASVKRMDAGSVEVARGVSFAGQAGESLGQIVTKAENVATMIRAITAAAEEAGAGSQQAATAASELSSKAEQLQSLVGQFKV